jgi:hypothetical protein
VPIHPIDPPCPPARFRRLDEKFLSIRTKRPHHGDSRSGKSRKKRQKGRQIKDFTA